MVEGCRLIQARLRAHEGNILPHFYKGFSSKTFLKHPIISISTGENAALIHEYEQPIGGGGQAAKAIGCNPINHGFESHPPLFIFIFKYNFSFRIF